MAELDPRSAAEQSRLMARYVDSYNGQKWGGVDESPDRKNLAMALDHLQETAAMLGNMAERVPGEGMTVAPDYRGYAHLGIGQYVLNNSGNDGEDPELIISIASEEEKAGRTVGDHRDNPEGHMIQPEQMCVRIRFANVAGLDAMEKQLRMLREECFPAAIDKAKEPPPSNQEKL